MDKQRLLLLFPLTYAVEYNLEGTLFKCFLDGKS